MNERIFALDAYVQFSEQAATVIEIIRTENSSIAVWGVKPGQTVPAHFHPDGQDTWVILQGTLTYFLGNGQNETLTAGQVALAEKNQTHGAVNNGNEDVVFVSIYSAPQIGYAQSIP